MAIREFACLRMFTSELEDAAAAEKEEEEEEKEEACRKAVVE